MYRPSDDTKKFWAFTVRKNCKACDRLNMKETDYDIYDSHVKILGGNILFRQFERDNRNRLHYHAILELPKKFYRKALYLEGYSYKLCDIFSMSGWLDYITKTVTNDLDSPQDDESIIIPNKSMFKTHLEIV